MDIVQATVRCSTLRRDNRIWYRVKVRTCQYLNNLIEQNHRAVKSRVGVMLGCKTFANAALTIAGIERTHPIRKGPFMLSRQRGPKPKLSMQAAGDIALA
jgi:transposase-like protein